MSYIEQLTSQLSIKKVIFYFLQQWQVKEHVFLDIRKNVIFLEISSEQIFWTLGRRSHCVIFSDM
jgi:hypothetical protein